MTIPYLDDEAIFLEDDQVRRGEIGYAFSTADGTIPLKKMLSAWSLFSKLLDEISKDVATGGTIEWQVMDLVIDKDEQGQQRATIKLSAAEPEGKQAEQLFVDLMRLLKKERQKR